MKALFPAAAAATLLLAGAAQAGVTVTYEDPGVENTTTTFTGAHGVETFDGFQANTVQNFTTDYGTGGTISGTYSNVVIRQADSYGGSGGTNYAGADFTHTIDLMLTDTNDAGGVKYFGFWLSALDAGNVVQLKSAGNTIFTFDPSQVLAQVSGNPAYFGNPEPGTFHGADGDQPFVFVNFFSTTAFNEVVFSESINGSGYESDNHTVGEDFRDVTGNPVPGVPEPASWALMIMGFGAAGAALRRRRMARV